MDQGGFLVNSNFTTKEHFYTTKKFSFQHATWNGLHVADLLFPWFLWIMGVCIPISIKSQIARNTSKKDIILSIFVVSKQPNRFDSSLLQFLI